jgi:hypothetical protein
MGSCYRNHLSGVVQMKTVLASLAITASISAADAHKKICFELGDGSSKSYQAANCRPKEWNGMPITCTFDNGDQETGCYKIEDGCLICAGMD